MLLVWAAYFLRSMSVKKTNLFILLVVGILFWVSFMAKSTGVILAGTVEIFSPKVYLLVFNPILQSKNSMTLVSYKNWNNPYTLAQQYIDNIRQISHDVVNYQIVTQKEVADIPLKQDGFDYTEQSYLDCIEGRAPCHNQPPGADFANYNKILSEYNICEMVNSGEIDELWMFGGPWFGFYEANMAGTGGFWTNGPVIENTLCSKPVHIMGFSYEVGVDMMLHNLGHRSEGTFDHFLGVAKNSTGMGWGDFRLNKGNNPNALIYGCGDIHFPANATSGYQYDNTVSVLSRCDDWLNYPNFTGRIQNVNCKNWGCPDQSQFNYLKWWFGHLPSAAGIDSNGKKNNWWFYIANTAPFVLMTPTPTQQPTSTPTVTITPTAFPALPTMRFPRTTFPTLLLPRISRTPTPTSDPGISTPTPTPFNVRPTRSFRV